MNTEIERRRFYLSKDSLALLDAMALRRNTSPSILLDEILKSLGEREKVR